MISLEIRIDYDDEDTARTILGSVLPDNGSYVESELDGSTVVFRMTADDAGSLRSTADDLLACVKTAEEASGLVTGTVTDDDA